MRSGFLIPRGMLVEDGSPVAESEGHIRGSQNCVRVTYRRGGPFTVPYSLVEFVRN